ncbi:hypothetical protein DPMN_028963 [Dreissena polymorpha]|uniref:Uncharacterized protein n=1 Tax=Dreissena polymorpha TaxID=45954 RepID=A0A9D4LZW5_DREPO|nr:hypothetical protein DPMN_028963 [Dreissena polymorpha]
MALVKDNARPMPDQLETAIQSLSGDNAGHVMTGTSLCTGPVTGPTNRSPVRPTGQRRPIRSPVRPTGHRRPVRPSGDRSGHWSDPPETGPVTGLTHRSTETGPVIGHRSDPPVTGHLLLMTGLTHWAPVTGHLLLMNGPTHRSPVICYWSATVNSC